MRITLLKWLVDKNRREILSFLGAGATVTVGAVWGGYTYFEKQKAERQLVPISKLSAPDVLRIEGKQTFRGYGFFTRRGFVITDRIPLERERSIFAVSTANSQDAPRTLQLVRLSDSVPLALSRVSGLAQTDHPFTTRAAGSLAEGEEVQLYRGPNYTTRGTITRLSVDKNIAGAQGTEIVHGLLETTGIASAGDSGAPVVDREGRIIGVLYARSADRSFLIPIEAVMSAFPEAF